MKMKNSSSSELEEKQQWNSNVSVSYIAYHFGTSGIGVAAATAVTHPLDVLKVRLQMQLVGQKGPLMGMGKFAVQMMKCEGPRALYLGLSPSLLRSFSYGGLRLVATALTNPMEVLKVRLQMNQSPGRGGAIGEMRRITSEEGARALWKGVGAAMTRAAALTASQMATYDESKRALLRLTPLEEGFYLHLISSTIAGAMSTLVTAPLDMVKTRLMMQKESKSAGIYKNGFHCAYKVIRTEGPRSLYKGGFTIFARLGPQTTITFLVCEKLRELAGLKAM